MRNEAPLADAETALSLIFVVVDGLPNPDFPFAFCKVRQIIVDRFVGDTKSRFGNVAEGAIKLQTGLLCGHEA